MEVLIRNREGVEILPGAEVGGGMEMGGGAEKGVERRRHLKSAGRFQVAGEEVGTQDYSEYYCQGYLDGGKARGEGGIHLGGNHKVGTPEDAGSGNQREDAADEEHGAGAPEAAGGGY